MSKAIASVVDVWTKIDIKTIQHELDEKVIEIAQQLEEGDQSRKKLVEQTKEFRKTLNEEQRKLVGPILKAFQNEVDGSSKRTKSMEQVLLKLYKQLIELPDPSPMLENAQRLQKRVEKVQDLEIENKQLRETLEQYNVEFAEVKNQEVTIKLLNNKIKELEERSEQYIQQRVKETEKELQRMFVDREEQLQNTQNELTKKLGDVETRNQNLQAQLKKIQNEHFELKSKQDELMNGRSCEMDLLMQDLDKMTERAVNAERLVDQYMQMTNKQLNNGDEASQSPQLASSSSVANELNNQQQHINAMKYNYQTSALELELVTKEKEISQLVEDIQRLNMKLTQSKLTHDNERSMLEEKLSSREKTIEKYEKELSSKDDYDEIKRELNIFKSIEFNNILSNNTDGSASSSDQSETGKDQAKSFEILLLEKNRHLQTENTQVKIRINELETKYNELNTENQNLKKQTVEQKSLIADMEKDLYRLANRNNLQSQSSNSNSTSTILDLESSPASSRLADHKQDSFELPPVSSGVANTKGDDSSLLSIVSSQRERLRTRVHELETESISNKQQVLFLTNELDRLRSDNVKLYEKIKFLQSNPLSLSNNKRGKGSSNDDFYDESGSNVINKYTNEYEQRLDPFSKFNYREKQKRYDNLKLHDKFTLNFGRFILSSKLARLIFCGYIMVIHMLIFVSLYGVAQKEARHADFSAECAKKFSAHMADVHGMKTFHPD